MTHLWLALALALQEPPPRPPEAGAAPLPSADALLEALSKRISLGAQVRFRGEYRDPVSYSDTAAGREDQDLYLSRIRLDLRMTPTDAIELFFQPQDQRTFGDEASVLSDENNLDIHQAYLEFKEILQAGLSLRLGRQELQYGDQRLVSPLDWSNIGRAWDGAKVRYSGGQGWIDAFYTVIREAPGAEDDHDFYGLYASFSGLDGHEVDAYVFGRSFGDDTFVDERGRTGDLQDGTAGIRWKGVLAALDASLEAIYQFGSYADDEVSAFGGAAVLGITGAGLPGVPRLALEYTYATGDDDPNDGTRQTFDPLYTFGHFYQGFADQVGWRNVHDLALLLKVAPSEGLSLHLDVHQFWLDERQDAWYGVAGTPTRRDLTGEARSHLGWETDLHARWTLSKSVKLWGGWSHFFAGPYVRDTAGSDRDMDWVFLQLTVEL